MNGSAYFKNKLYFMCSTLTQGDSKNCVCKFAHLCKSRKKLEAGEIKVTPPLKAFHLDETSLRIHVAPVYHTNWNSPIVLGQKS